MVEPPAAGRADIHVVRRGGRGHAASQGARSGREAAAEDEPDRAVRGTGAARVRARRGRPAARIGWPSVHRKARGRRPMTDRGDYATATAQGAARSGGAERTVT